MKTTAFQFVFLAIVGVFFTASSANAQQILSGHVPEAVTSLHLQPIGRLAATNRLHLAIGLPLRNPAGLSNLLEQIYDPSSTNYHHYLKPKEFTKLFGPTEQDYQAVVAFVKSNGWTLTKEDSGRVLVDVSATAADIERVCHVKMQVYQHPTEARTFYAPDTEPSLDLATPVADISGINNYVLPRPASLRQETPATSEPAAGSGPDGSLQGYDFRAAYAPGVSLDGSGQTVGLLEFDGFYTNDIITYETNAGLPNVPVTVEPIDGFSGNPSTNANHIGEVSLDIEMVISMAPGISQLIVYETGTGGTANDILEQMASDGTAAQISSSWFFDANTTTDGYLQQLAAQGQSFFEASGDDLAYSGGIHFLDHAGPPADDPYLTSVGGTTLHMSPQGFRVSETVWNNFTGGSGTNGSGGGISTKYTIPTWQQGTRMVTNHGSTTMRNIPDVAMAADNVWVNANDGEGETFWGTSCAAPLWAGFTALINEQRTNLNLAPIGFINPAIYALGNSAGYTAAFNDITAGNNTNFTSTNLFFAVPGYDLATGWGTPNGMDLIDALAETNPLVISPAAGFAASGSVGGPFSPTAEIFKLKNTGKAPLSWSANSLSSLLAVAPASGLLKTGATVNVTASLTASAKSLPMGLYAGSIVFSNVTLGTEQNRLFTVQAGAPPLTFDDLTETKAKLVPAGYGGLDWSNFYAMSAVTFSHNPSGYRAGMVSAPNVVYNAHGDPASILGPVPFDLLSADLTAAWDNNLSVEVEGFVGSKMTHSKTVTLSVSAPALVTFDFYNVDSVVFISSGGVPAGYGTNTGEQFVMDNVSVVPHYPATGGSGANPPGVNRLAVTPAEESEVQTLPVVPPGTVLSLGLNAQVGNTYQLQYSASLARPDWINVGTSFTATNSMVTVQDSPTNNQRFYRLLLMVP